MRGKRRYWLLALCALLLSVALPAKVARAVDDEPAITTQAVLGNDYPYQGYSMNECDPYGFVYRNCTSFCCWRLRNTGGVDFGNWYGGVRWGDGGNWGSAARSLGINVDMNPAVGSIAYISSGTNGHVAWVAEVGNGAVTVEEYNWEGDGAYHTITWPVSHYNGFIHIKDQGSNSVTGAFEEAQNYDGRLRVYGWAKDVNYPNTPVRVDVYVGGSAGSGAPCYSIWANKTRSDVGSCYYDEVIDVAPYGTQTVYVYGINADNS